MPIHLNLVKHQIQSKKLTADRVDAPVAGLAASGLGAGASDAGAVIVRRMRYATYRPKAIPNRQSGIKIASASQSNFVKRPLKAAHMPSTIANRQKKSPVSQKKITRKNSALRQPMSISSSKSQITGGV